LFQLEI